MRQNKLLMTLKEPIKREHNADRFYHKFCYAISSLTQDQQHVYMGDIDHDLPDIYQLCDQIIQDFDLGCLFLIKSSKGFNIISLDKMSLDQVNKINLAYPDHIDQVFNKLQYDQRGFYTIRVGDDKDLVNVFHDPQDHHVFSNAHRIFLNHFFGIEVPFSHCDAYENIKLIKYFSNKNGVDLPA